MDSYAVTQQTKPLPFIGQRRSLLMDMYNIVELYILTFALIRWTFGLVGALHLRLIVAYGERAAGPIPTG